MLHGPYPQKPQPPQAICCVCTLLGCSAYTCAPHHCTIGADVPASPSAPQHCSPSCTMHLTLKLGQEVDARGSGRDQGPHLLLSWRAGRSSHGVGAWWLQINYLGASCSPQGTRWTALFYWVLEQAKAPVTLTGESSWLELYSGGGSCQLH